MLFTYQKLLYTGNSRPCSIRTFFSKSFSELKVLSSVTQVKNGTEIHIKH